MQLQMVIKVYPMIPTMMLTVKTDAQLAQLGKPALGAKRRESAAICPGARAIPSPKKVARRCRLWSIYLTLS
jgi:hypothetical protein